jgi:hypothetical protein
MSVDAVFLTSSGEVLYRTRLSVIPRIGETVVTGSPANVLTVQSVRWLLLTAGLASAEIVLGIDFNAGNGTLQVAPASSAVSTAEDPEMADLLDQAEAEMHAEGFVSESIKRKIGARQVQLRLVARPAA